MSVANFQQYIKDLQSIPIDKLTEHSHRGSLQTLITHIASQVAGKIEVLHEPKRQENYGSPDFQIFTAGSIIGYIENKKIDEDLNKTVKSEQIKKYKALSDNIIVTNYLEWIWIKDGEILRRENLCYLTDIENKKFKLDTGRVEAVEKLIKDFLSQSPKGIAKPKDLARALAQRSANLKIFLVDELKRQETEHTEGLLWGLYNTFRTVIFSELTIDEFADAFAQMLSYGLFLAKINADTKVVTLQNAKQFIPASFELIKELVKFLDELEQREYRETLWIVKEILTLLNNLDLRAIQDNLSFSKRKTDQANDFFAKDPYIYFYEDFLSVYDSKLRKSKGVYYTPPPVVNFIVRAVNDILKDTFEITEGLADRKKVTVLDFATGTGTFLLEVFQQILDTTAPAKRDMLIKEHLLKNLYGFEYLIAPYTIAHLKLSQYLKESGYVFKDGERLKVYLTNTLEPLDPQMNLLLPALSSEGVEANKVKKQPILVITGNPPYFYASKNPSERKIVEINNGKERTRIELTSIGKLIKDYYVVDGQKLNEANPKGLQDDYVKFIRFAQDKIDKVDEGMIAIITNHSFLDNPTFRGMRQSLMNSFDRLYFIDLHGNSKKKEKTPQGTKDENVFDIEQGVAISLLIKKKGISKEVFVSDFWGTRETK